MIIRKIRKNGILSGKKIIKRIIILLIVLLIIKSIQYINNKINNDHSRIVSMQVGESVAFSGYLSVDNNFPYYTHSIIDTDGDKIWLKSATINLNKYKGKVEIVGKIERFLKLVPIVEVDTIKLPNQGLIIKNNIYYFTNDFLYLDFTNQPQLSAVKSGNDVNILYGDNVVVSIERFFCGAVVKRQDCTALIGDYQTTQKDNFDSLWGYTFYRHGTGIRTAFDGDLYGYVFKNIDDTMMTNLSNMIRIVNKDFILANKMADIRKNCSDQQNYLQSISDAKLRYADPKALTLLLTGESNTQTPAACTIVFAPWNSWAVTSAKFSLGK